MSGRTWMAVAVAVLLAPLTAGAASAGGGRPQLAVGQVETIRNTSASDRAVRLVVDGHGRTVAAWMSVSTDSAGATTAVVRAARRHRDGTWTSPRILRCAHGVPCPGGRPRIAVDRRGVVTVAWTDGVGVYAVRRPPGGPWGQVHRLTTSTRPVRGVRLGVAADGGVGVAWMRHDHVHVVRRPVGEGGWTAPVKVGYGDLVDIGVSDRGRILVAWEADGLSARQFVPGHGWLRERRYLGAGDEYALAVGPRGHGIVVWTREGVDSWIIEGREVTAAGRWSRFEFISDREHLNLDGAPRPVIDPHGVITVAWTHCTYHWRPMSGWVARKAPGGSWHRARVTDLGTGSAGWGSQLVSNDHGDLALTFPGRLLLRPHDGVWSNPAELPGSIGVGPAGTATRMWSGADAVHAQRVHVRR